MHQIQSLGKLGQVAHTGLFLAAFKVRVRRDMWKRLFRHVSPVVAFGSWGWLWDGTTRSRVVAIVNCMIRNAMGLHNFEEEGWFSWQTRTSGMLDLGSPASFVAHLPSGS